MTTELMVALLYQAYPKKVGKGAAKKSIEKALKKTQFDVLLDAVTEYAKACESIQVGREFIPYPATWFNQERWDDDRTEWWRGNGGPKSVAEHNDSAFREVFGDG